MKGVDVNRKQLVLAAIFERAVIGGDSIRAPPSRRIAVDVQVALGARRRERRDFQLATNEHGHNHTFV